MISVCDDCEYTVTIADMIESLSRCNSFILKIWVQSSELPLTYSELDDFKFLQESIRVSNDESIEYILYDMVSHIQIIRRR